MILTSAYTRVAIPWDVVCPFDGDGQHHVRDAYSELFEETVRTKIAHGDAAMSCPTCGKPWKFVNGWFSNPVDGTGLPLGFWSRRIWNTLSDEKKDEARQRVPNVEGYLR